MVDWFAMTVPGFGRGVVVTFNAVAHHHCLSRFGAWDVVITWDECQAWAAGVEQVAEHLRPGRSLEALAYFCARQGLTFA